MAESLTKNVKKCSKRKTDISQVIEDDDGPKTSTAMGSTCPLMSGYKFGPNTSEGQKSETWDQGLTIIFKQDEVFQTDRQTK